MIDTAELSKYDFSDAWLLSCRFDVRSISLQIDVRDLQRTVEKGKAQYSRLQLDCTQVSHLNISVQSPLIIMPDDDFGDIHSLTFKPCEDDATLECSIDIDHGDISFRLRGLTVHHHELTDEASDPPPLRTFGQWIPPQES